MMTIQDAMYLAALVKDVRSKSPRATVSHPSMEDALVALADMVEKLSGLAAIGRSLCDAATRGDRLAPFIDNYRVSADLAFGGDDD